MRTQELMIVTFPSIPATASLQQAGVMLEEAGVALLPVRDGDRMVGTVSERDLAVRGCGQGLDPRVTPVARVMADPVSCSADARLQDALALMRSHRVPVLVVHDRQKHVVGLVTTQTLLDALDSLAPVEDWGPLPDEVKRVRGDPV